MKFSHTLTTRATPAAVWSAWTAVAQWPRWDSEIVSAQLYGAFQLNATGQLTPVQGPVSKFVISQLDWENSYTFTTQLPLCRLHVHRFFTRPELGQSEPLRFTHEVSFEGPLAFVFSRLLGRKFQRVLPDVMQQLKQTVESTEFLR